MYIREIRIEKYRHLANITITPPKAGPVSTAIVLAGPNGGGKTSILEVIALALANSFSFPLYLDRHLEHYAFEVDLGFTEEEADLIRETAAKSPQAFVKEEVERFASDRQYTRYFNRSPMEPSNLYWHDRAHNLVQTTLRGAYGRPVGFSLRADRNYPASSAFQQHSLLSPQQDTVTRNLQSAYHLPEFQYRDMLDFLIEGQYHHLINVGRHVESGMDRNDLPKSPVEPYNELLGKLMPGYRITTKPTENTPTNLYVEIPNGELIAFSDLSSGEREIFFVLANFIRQNVSNAVITVDEPELHLHPELSRRLVRTMLDIKPGNQIWLATHNGEVFDEVGRDRTFFVSRDPERGSVVRRATETTTSEDLLREMFGYSGYIGVARSLLFLEGEQSSLDRRVFSRLFPEELSGVRLVPAGGVDSVTRINSAMLKIIEEGVGWMNFYALRDRDYLTDEEVEHYNSHATGRLRVLQRCHIENYLLHDASIATAMTDIFDRPMTAQDVRDSLREVARKMSAEVLTKMVSFTLQRRTWPEDFSVGDYRSVSLFKSQESMNTGLLSSIETTYQAQADKVRSAWDDRLSHQAISDLMEGTVERVTTALLSDDGPESWRYVFPGKRLIVDFAKAQKVDPVALQNSVLGAMAHDRHAIPKDLTELIAVVAQGSPFS